MILQWLLQTMPNLVPRALVLRFFLAPDYLIDVGVFFEKRGKLRNGKWIQLFNSDDRDVSNTMHLACLEQVVVNLAAAENDTTRPVRRNILNFGNEKIELTSDKPVSGDTAILWRNKLFGVITISGLRKSRTICRRSM